MEKEKTENIGKNGAGSWRKNFFPIPYSQFPQAIKKRIQQFTASFLLSGVALISLMLLSGAYGELYLGIIIFAFGIWAIGSLWYSAANDQIGTVEGVIIDICKKGTTLTTRQRYLLVQCTNGAVYQVNALGSKNYKVGNIVRIYADKNKMNNLIDGVYMIFNARALERLSAKITSDEEDEMLASIEQEDAVK